MIPRLDSLAQAIFIVNKHAKTALEPKNLYNLKRLALNKLLQEGKAKKLGLHFSDNPRFAAQQSDVIISCDAYVFHLPPTKEDLKNLPHLGNRSSYIRNPKAVMSLSKAKQILHIICWTSSRHKRSKHKNMKKTESMGQTEATLPQPISFIIFRQRF